MAMGQYPKLYGVCEVCGESHEWATRDGQGRLIKPYPVQMCCDKEVEPCPRRDFGGSPFFLDDIKPFQSPLDPSVTINSRSEKREMIKRHNLIEVGNERLPEKEPMKVDRNEVRRDIATAIEMTKHR